MRGWPFENGGDRFLDCFSPEVIVGWQNTQKREVEVVFVPETSSPLITQQGVPGAPVGVVPNPPDVGLGWYDVPWDACPGPEGVGTGGTIARKGSHGESTVR